MTGMMWGQWGLCVNHRDHATIMINMLAAICNFFTYVCVCACMNVHMCACVWGTPMPPDTLDKLKPPNNLSRYVG